MRNEHIGSSTSFGCSTFISQLLTMNITFSRIVCSILYSKYFFRFKMLSSSNGNDSEKYEQAETFNSSKDWGWIESPSNEDVYDPDW